MRIIEGFMLFGIPKVTNPAPLRIAAIEHKAAAPENRAEPARINICPKSPLCAFGFLCNNRVGNRIIFYVRNGYHYLGLFDF